MSKVGVLGSGEVGRVLADGFLSLGDEVMRGSRSPEKLASWKEGAGAKASTGSFAETARFGEIVVLAVKGNAAESCVADCGDGLDDKIVLDTTNPISGEPAENGVLRYFTGPNESLMERLQKKAPKARFVKCFSCVGNALMVRPKLSSMPSMFICGNDGAAKDAVRSLLGRLGWDAEDMGMVEGARAIEPLCILWCIPGLLRGEWMHALKLVRP